MANEADTVWQPRGSLIGEFSVGTAINIVDPSAVSLVDPSAVQVVDTGVTLTLIQPTTWTNSPGN